MVSTFLSRIIGLVRVKYIVWLFGRGVEADAFNAAFVLPDMISYFLVGGAASITFVTILTRYRETGREAEGERSLSVILTTMYLVLGAAIVLAEIFAPWYIRWWFNGFDAQKAALCVHLTRILLPAQLCLLCRRSLWRGAAGAQAVQRAGGGAADLRPGHHRRRLAAGQAHRRLLAGHRHGGGSRSCGPFLLNWLFARRAGTRYRPILDWRDEGLREWVRLSLPLMAGVSLVTADNWIIAHFASSISGAVSLMSYAKQLFTAPMAMLAQAAGAASMPFFASLWSQRAPLRVRHRRGRLGFARGRAGAARRLGHGRAGWPAIDLVFTGGRFSAADARECAVYFAVFSVSMFLWSAQAIYARAFYAAGNTFVPMVASTVVTVVSLPIYYVALSTGTEPRAWRSPPTSASRCKPSPSPCCCTSAAWSRWPAWTIAEMGRCLLAAVAGGAAAWLLAWGLGSLFGHLPGIALLHHAHYYADAAILIAGIVLWTVLAKWVLEKAGSALPRVAMRRLGIERIRASTQSTRRTPPLTQKRSRSRCRISFSASLLQRPVWTSPAMTGAELRRTPANGRHLRRLGVGLADVDAALEERAILDADARRGHVAAQRALGANVHAVRGGDIAAHLAQNDDLAGGDVGRHLAVAAHGHAVAGKVDAALHLAVDKQRLGAGDLALDEQAFADGGLVAGRRSRRGLRASTTGAARRRTRRLRGGVWSAMGPD